MSLSIQTAGLLTTVQDAGRFGYRHVGVVVSGAMDASALRLGNLLVGNPAGAAALEFAFPAPRIRFEDEHLIGLTGADFSPALNGQPAPLGRPILVAAGCELTFRAPRAGRWGYLSVAGGLAVPPVLGSRATYLRAGLGGFAGRALRAGDVLPVGPHPRPLPPREGSLASARTSAERNGSLDTSHIGRAWAGGEAEKSPADWAAAPWFVPALVQSSQPTVIRALPGPEYGRFAEASQQAFWEQEFSVEASSDRMGYRLGGPALALAEPADMLSSAVAFGTVQVPPGGRAIVLMADHQTTGGYPRIGQIVSPDLGRLAQVPPGRRLRFQLVTLAEAHRALLAQHQYLERLERAVALRVG